jgi:hypothetical protein
MSNINGNQITNKTMQDHTQDCPCMSPSMNPSVHDNTRYEALSLDHVNNNRIAFLSTHDNSFIVETLVHDTNVSFSHSSHSSSIDCHDSILSDTLDNSQESTEEFSQDGTRIKYNMLRNKEYFQDLLPRESDQEYQEDSIQEESFSSTKTRDNTLVGPSYGQEENEESNAFLYAITQSSLQEDHSQDQVHPVCVVCGIEMPDNPRQLCGKFYCINETK